MLRNLFCSLVLSAGMVHAAPARTYYDGLNFSTPESTTQLFLKAYQSKDYLTVFYALSPQAQQNWTQMVMVFDCGQIFKGSAQDIIKNSGLLEDPRESEVFVDVSLQFDRTMMAADALNGLPFLLKDAQIQKISLQKESATVTVQNGVAPKTLTFKLNRLKNLKWKVHQVLFQGSNPSILPWGLRPE